MQHEAKTWEVARAYDEELERHGEDQLAFRKALLVYRICYPEVSEESARRIVARIVASEHLP